MGLSSLALNGECGTGTWNRNVLGAVALRIVKWKKDSAHS